MEKLLHVLMVILIMLEKIVSLLKHVITTNILTISNSVQVALNQVYVTEKHSFNAYQEILYML